MRLQSYTQAMDIDDELQMLQRQLMEVQEQKTNPMSERTVAEIIIKLLQNGFKFFATTDGNEYITPEKLDQEIIQFVEERGRTKVGILPQLLNLNPDLIESRINIVCQKSTHIRNGENLLSKAYLRNFVHSVKQTLKIQGVVNLDELALSQEFNMPFLLKILEQNLHQLDAEIIGNQLVTGEYRRMKKRKILGFLLAINRPINIDTFLKYVKLTDSNPAALIEQLISQGKLKGRCQNSYYIPDKFSANQKEMVQKFFESNGFIDFEMLSKNYQVSKPEEWIKKNLKGDFVIIEEVCFNKTKLASYKTQLESMMKGEGFFEISSIIPFDLDDRKMEKFLTENCQLTDFVLDQGICYSEEWLNKCVNEFRDKVIYDIFFKKNEPKGKKKGGKKEKEVGVTPQELVETLFDARLAQYSVAENMADSLVGLVNERIQKLKTQCQKQLTQSQGVITSTFLKYRKCKTILRSPDNLQRVLNTIDKQKKKGNVWVDPDFGPSETDPDGKFSLIHYDAIFPKQWPEVENIKWVELTTEELNTSPYVKTKFMHRSIVTDVLHIIEHFNSQSTGKKLTSPRVISKNNDEESAPFTFKFFGDDSSERYVLVDSRVPFINSQPLSCTNWLGLAEKAYAKLRYCYKGTLGVGIQQVIFELTGTLPLKLGSDGDKDHPQLTKALYEKYLQSGSLVVVMAEGQAGKKVKLDGQDTQFRSARPYQISLVPQSNEQNVLIFPENSVHSLGDVVRMFKNIYIVGHTAQE